MSLSIVVPAGTPSRSASGKPGSKVVVHAAREAVLEISDENSVTALAPVNRKRKRMEWLEEDELVLLDILHKGKHGSKSNVIPAQDWRNIIHEFWARTSKRERYDAQCIKQKYLRLKYNWGDFKELLATCPGYGWDQETNKVVVPTEVWVDHVARFSDHKKFRYRGLKHFDKLDEIFGYNCALGSHVVYSTRPHSPQPLKVPETAQADCEEEEQHNDDDLAANAEDVYRPMSATNNGCSGKWSGHGKSIATGYTPSNWTKKSRVSELAKVVDCFKQYLQWKRERTESLQAKLQPQPQPDPQPNLYSEQAAIIQLQQIFMQFQVDKSQFTRAMGQLVDREMRITFMDMTDENQAAWARSLGKM